MNTIKRLVVKLGTATLLNGGETLDQEIFSRVARQVAELKTQGVEIVIVSSGAIAAGKEESARFGQDTSGLSNKDLNKVLALNGAHALMNRWAKAFEPFNIPVGQVLVAYRNWCDTGERLNIKASILSALLIGTVPIINENDPVADEEVRLKELGLSDNDGLAAKIAWLVRADAIIFFTDAGAVFESNPAAGLTVRSYGEIDARNIPLPLRTSVDKSKTGRGGIKSKLMSAAFCFKQGMRVSIGSLNGAPDSIIRFWREEHVGTMMGTRNILNE